MIHLIIGRQGSGKTLLLVRLAEQFRMANPQATIYANFHLRFEYDRIKYKNIIACKLVDCITLLDEIHLILPARLAMRRVNQQICDKFLSMARKQNNEIFGTTQTLRKVDIRFREEADYVYYCTKYAYLHGRWMEILHDSMLKKSDMVMIAVEVEDVLSGNFVRLAFHGNRYYDLYDTHEIIEVEGLEEALEKSRKRRK